MNHFLIDGFGLAFRSHFSSLSLSTSSGVLSGCLYGFMKSLMAQKKKYPDFHFTVVWDNEATNKKALYPSYKANRAHFNLSEQITDLKSLCASINVYQSDVIGEEADDVIASLAEQLKKEGLVYIYTGDKDLMQLVENGKVIVIYQATGEAFDEEAVKNKFGVSPSELACFLSFRGDTSDNIPGVPRAPSKVLASLVTKYKTPDMVYASIPEEKLTDFQRTSIVQSEKQIYLNFQLINLNRNLDYCVVDGQDDAEKIKLILDKYEIKSISINNLIELFHKESSFLKRSGPAVENFSLFEGM